MLCTPTQCGLESFFSGNKLSALVIKKFLVLKNINGNDARTEIPKAKNDDTAKGSRGENVFNRKEAELGPKREDPRYIVIE
jgi:hypothetical protein